MNFSMLLSLPLERILLISAIKPFEMKLEFGFENSSTGKQFDTNQK